MSIEPVTTSTSIEEVVKYQIQGEVAIIEINNPPVNSIGWEVRKGIYDAINTAQGDDVSAIVIAGSGRAFGAGADINQFNTPAVNAEPTTRQIIQLISTSRVPVVSSIHGFALGGSFELALGCHYRLMERNASIGLPEVGIGIIPGGGGTQRLPRIAGVSAALDIITSGRRVSADEALDLGVVDEVFSGNPVDAGIAFVHSLSYESHPHPDRIESPAHDEEVFQAFRKKIRSKAPNRLAMLAAIDAIEFSTQAMLSDGLNKERAIFSELVESPESKALRYQFAAERAASKIKNLSNDIELRQIEEVAVIGAGTMGSGIAMAVANSGTKVTLIDVNREGLERGQSMINENYQISITRGKLSQSEVDERLGLINYGHALRHAGSADLIIEAVFEDMDVKKQVFGELEKFSKPRAILATNTSRLDVNEIAQSTSRPCDVVGTHFFSPANVMRLLEVVRADSTSQEVLATILAFAKRISKVPVVVGVCEGFVGNRMLTPYWREAWFLLEEGASPSEVDLALENFGMAMGPLATADLAGLDINWATRKRLEPTRNKDLRYPLVADRICEAGRFGRKTKAGYYKYEDGSRQRIDDHDALIIIEDTSDELGIQRRMIDPDEIVERCILALVNEGAQILEDGIVQRASDIDVVYVNGYGFPAYLGGPMYYAEQQGLPNVLAKIENLHRIHGEHWKPAPLLKKLVSEGKTQF
ncbi:3-hydroxyacyl-CoA dehydrogenase NAD-binding domain-containing protein [Corynebacterium sp. S7]